MASTNPGIIKGVEIFAAGTHRGKTYTEADLDAMVDNFNRYSNQGDKTLVKVPVVIGHEEDQSLLQNTGIPKVGTPQKVWKEKQTCRFCSGRKFTDQESMQPCHACSGTGQQVLLKADFADVPSSIARLINARAYDKVSCEVYDKPPEGVPGQGKMLRRVALLGGELPHIKSLADVPQAQGEDYGELYYVGSPVLFQFSQATVKDDACTVFCEVTKMPREELLQKLQGGNQTILASFSEEQLTETVRLVEAVAVPPVVDEFSEASLKALPVEEGVQKVLDLGRKCFGDKFVLPGAKEESQTKEDSPAQGLAKPLHFSEEQLAAAVKPMVDAAVAKIVGDLNPIKTDVQKFKDDTRKERIAAFCDSYTKSGHIRPWEMDRTNPLGTIMDELMRRDATAVIGKFKDSQGQEVEMTELDLAMERIKQRPPQKFGETVKQSASTGDAARGEQSMVEIERFCEENEESLGKIGFAKAEFVEVYKKASEKERQELLDLVG